MEYPNWFTCYADQFFGRHLSHLAGKRNLNFLQIGAYTGDASVWLLENILTAESSMLYDVDTWEGSDEPEHEPFDWPDIERVYDGRLTPFKNHVKKKTRSDWYLSGFGSSGPYFDFVYVDGDHAASAVLADALNAFRLLKPGGLMAFDDYQWKPYEGAPPTECPGLAIDAFTACYHDQLDILEAGLQVWIRKHDA